MTVAELVSELLYAGKTRNEIAGYDDAFMCWVLCRKRDDIGQLVRRDPDLPRWVTENLDGNGRWNLRHRKPYGVVLQQLMEKCGLNEHDRCVAWNKWKQANPGYGVIGVEEQYG